MFKTFIAGLVVASALGCASSTPAPSSPAAASSSGSQAQAAGDIIATARGAGSFGTLLAAVEAEALKRGAIKITLEVLSGNHPAKALYAANGYGDYQLDPAAGQALFWQKRLT